MGTFQSKRIPCRFRATVFFSGKLTQMTTFMRAYEAMTTVANAAGGATLCKRLLRPTKLPDSSLIAVSINWDIWMGFSISKI